MINLSRVQRERIVLVVLIAAGLSVFLWQYRASQKKTLALREQALRDARQTVESGRRQCALTNKFETEFESASAKVRQAESRMASGDVYRWVIKTFVEFPAAQGIEFGNFEPPQVGDLGIYPKVPYQGATFLVSGSAYYDDLGTFVAALENSYPHLRIKHLEIEAKPSVEDSTEPEDEKLSFRMECVSLVRTNASALQPAGSGPALTSNR